MTLVLVPVNHVRPTSDQSRTAPLEPAPPLPTRPDRTLQPPNRSIPGETSTAQPLDWKRLAQDPSGPNVPAGHQFPSPFKEGDDDDGLFAQFEADPPTKPSDLSQWTADRIQQERIDNKVAQMLNDPAVSCSNGEEADKPVHLPKGRSTNLNVACSNCCHYTAGGKRVARIRPARQGKAARVNRPRSSVLESNRLLSVTTDLALPVLTARAARQVARFLLDYADQLEAEQE
ncbi:hypothetical protein F4778DRAFT_781304 [Xylariomycetidae sp. FL2044]|nr:hypothetical protein F4778DRAFT_781304 [Xylariomycetidae sp. FL2044]